MINLQVPGEITPQELKAIEAVVGLVPSNGLMVEVGSYLGRSSWHWAKNAHPSVTVYCLDPWDGYRGSSLTKFSANVADCPNVIPLQGYSPKDYQWWDKPLDLYFEDAVHKNPVLHENLLFWSSFLKPHGILCGHDYSPKFRDVISEVEALAVQRSARLFQVESFWCLLPEGDIQEREEVAAVGQTLTELASRVVKDFAQEITIDESAYTIKRGETLTIAGRVKNCTGDSWPIAAGQYSVQAGLQVWAEAEEKKFADIRCALPCTDLPPGESAAFSFELDTKAYAPGEYRLVLDLVIDYAFWFRDRGATPAVIPLTVE